jgi:cell division protein FtsQ
MQKNKVIQKVVILVVFLLAGGGMIALLAAANSSKEDHECKEVVISVKGSGEKYFIEKADILNRLKESAGGPLVGKAISNTNLSRLEKALKQNAWIKEAQLYFDSRDVLHVIVTEREPMARVFTTEGGSFYLDSTGVKMPLLNKVSIRLPVITNFTSAKKWVSADSALVKDLASLMAFVSGDEFWKAQIAQIDINANREIELIPVVGNHIIKLGRVENLDKKLHNLLLFYQQVLSKTGFDVYKVVDIQYAGQVVGVKTNPTAAIDSIQLQKNIEALIEKTKAQAQNDSLFSEKVTQFVYEKDSAFRKLDSIVTNPAPERKPPSSGSAEKQTSNVAKPQTSNTLSKPKENKPVQEPKAVMPKKLRE